MRKSTRINVFRYPVVYRYLFRKVRRNFFMHIIIGIEKVSGFHREKLSFVTPNTSTGNDIAGVIDC